MLIHGQQRKTPVALRRHAMNNLFKPQLRRLAGEVSKFMGDLLPVS
jgi:hypothetical protein